MSDNTKVDWTQPIEAVHENGRVVAVELVKPAAFGSSNPDASGDYWTTPFPGETMKRCWAPSGLRTDIGWRIRNVAQTQTQVRTTDEQLTHYAERCKALVERMAAVNSFLSGEAGPLFVEARAIVASMVEVDGDLVEAREMCAEYAVTAYCDSGLAAEYRNGDCDDQMEMRMAIEGLKRGRQLAAGEG